MNQPQQQSPINPSKIKFSTVLTLAVLALIGVIAVMQCNNKTHSTLTSTDTAKTSDTVYLPSDTVFAYKPIVKWKVSAHDTVVVPSDSAELYRTYYNLHQDHYAKNIYRDTLRKDSTWVAIDDTVSQNMIVGRGVFLYSPTRLITNTSIITNEYTAPPRRQLFLGGGIYSTQDSIPQSINVGVLYKTKSDFVLNPTLGLQRDGVIIYGISAYKLLKLHK